MCGVGGIAARPGVELDRATLDRMHERLACRGPDGPGEWVRDGIALLHSRLSIIDLSSAGAQPMWNEDGTIGVVFNGEIYNFASLRAELMGRGHRFSSATDTEVIVHLVEERGVGAALDALRGMFALALVDVRVAGDAVVYLARDRHGIKPMVYATLADRVVFGSQTSVVLADSDVSRELSPEAVARYLTWGFVPSPASVFRAVHKLPPGHLLEIRGGAIVAARSFAGAAPLSRVVAEAQATAVVRETLMAAVRRHLVADVPVAALLSSGIDSSLVTVMAASDHPSFTAYTATTPGFSLDELADAQVLASERGVVLKPVVVPHDEFSPEIFDAVGAALDEPLAVASAVSLFRLFGAIAGEATVVLSGDGADELFGGYDRHDPLPVLPMWAATPRRAALVRRTFELVSKLIPIGALTRRATVAADVERARSRHDSDRYMARVRWVSAEAARTLVPPAGAAAIDDDTLLRDARRVWDAAGDASALERMLAVDRHTSLVDEMFAKVDGMSMAHGIEVRVPFLDDAMVELSSRLPATSKRRNGRGKAVLRDVLAELGLQRAAALPKRGFNAPYLDWMAHPDAAGHLRARLNDPALRHALASVLDLDAVTSLLDAPRPWSVETGRLAFALTMLTSYLAARLVVDGSVVGPCTVT